MPVGGEPEGSEPESRLDGLRTGVGAGSTALFPVSLEAGRKRPRGGHAESLRAKRGGGGLCIWSVPALIAGEIGRDLDVSINPGGAGRFNQNHPLP